MKSNDTHNQHTPKHHRHVPSRGIEAHNLYHFFFDLARRFVEGFVGPQGERLTTTSQTPQIGSHIVKNLHQNSL